MELLVATILQAPEKVTRHNFQEQIALDLADEKLLEPVVGELEVTRASDQVLQVKGHFKALLQLRCDRCAEPFKLPVEFDVDEALEVITGPITSEEVEETVSASGVLDATDLIRQSMLLSLPARHLCGCELDADLAAEDKLDPRWAALKALHQEPNG